jgi:hypothetical protein
MTEKAIVEALQKGVIAAVAASVSPSLPVKYIGRNFQKPSTGGWLEVIYIPNNVGNDFWGEGKRHQGLLRLMLHWNMDDKGLYTPLSTLESITSYFVKGRKFTDAAETVMVSINDNPNFLGIIEEAPEMLLTSSIRYFYLET